MLNGAKLREVYYRVMEEAAWSPFSPPTADMMYLVGQTPDNQESVLNCEQVFDGPIGFIGYEQTGMGYPGFDVWAPELLKRGVSRERIVPILGSYVELGDGRRTIHTLSEMEALAKFAKLENIRNVILVAPKFHLLRSFMAAVLATSRHNSGLRVYPLLGTGLDWDKEVSS